MSVCTDASRSTASDGRYRMEESTLAKCVCVCVRVLDCSPDRELRFAQDQEKSPSTPQLGIWMVGGVLSEENIYIYMYVYISVSICVYIHLF